MKYQLKITSQFKKEIKKLEKSGRFDNGRIALRYVTELLLAGQSLPEKYRDHGLRGELAGYRECHILPDLLLVYQYHENELILLFVTIGSHSALFG